MGKYTLQVTQRVMFSERLEEKEKSVVSSLAKLANVSPS